LSHRAFNSKSSRSERRIAKPETRLEALEVRGLDTWNSHNDMHIKELETQYKQLYRQIETDDIFHTSVQKRRAAQPSLTKSVMSSAHESARMKARTEFVQSRQAKEFEERMDKEYRALEQQVKVLKEIVKQKSSLVCDIRGKLHIHVSERTKKSTSLAREETAMKDMRRLNLANFMLKKAGLQRRMTKNAENYDLIIGSLNMQADSALEEVETMRTEIETCKEKMRAIRTALVKHFTKVLKEGTDFRHFGLRWVVIELWKCDVKVTFDLFPSFLDSTSADVIMSLAAKEQELQNLQAFLQQAYRQSSLETNEFRPLSNIRAKLLRVRSENIKKQKTTARFDRHTKQVTLVKEIVADSEDEPSEHSDLRSDWGLLVNAEAKLEQVKAKIEEQQAREVQRIAHAYFYDSASLLRPVKDRRLCIAAIVGSEVVDRYLYLVKKGEREVRQLKEMTQTFNFFKL
jgi:hypothetical protein